MAHHRHSQGRADGIGDCDDTPQLELLLLRNGDASAMNQGQRLAKSSCLVVAKLVGAAVVAYLVEAWRIEVWSAGRRHGRKPLVKSVAVGKNMFDSMTCGAHA